MLDWVFALVGLHDIIKFRSGFPSWRCFSPVSSFEFVFMVSNAATSTYHDGGSCVYFLNLDSNSLNLEWIQRRMLLRVTRLQGVHHYFPIERRRVGKTFILFFTGRVADVLISPW